MGEASNSGSIIICVRWKNEFGTRSYDDTTGFNVTDEHWLILSFSTWNMCMTCSGSHVCVIYLKIHNLPPKIQ